MSRLGWRVVATVVLVRVALASLGPAVTAFCITGLALLWMPWLIARRVAVPLGLPRLASALAFVAGYVWDGDHRGGALLAGAWALLHRPSAEGAAWLERLAQRLAPLRPSGLVGAGLLAAAQGDTGRARRLLVSLDFLPAESVPAAARQMAMRYRLADALARADWSAASVLGFALGSRAGQLASLAATRLGGLGAVSDAELERAWLWTRRAPVLRPLVLRALKQKAPVEPARPSATVAVADAADALHAALAAHAALVAGPPPTLDALAAAAAAWDDAWPDVEERAHERAAALGVSDAARTAAELRAQVESELAELALGAGLIVPLEPGILRGVHRQVRQRLLEEVEAACRSLKARVDAGRKLPAVLEWTELLSLRALHDRAVRIGGLEVQRLIFSELHDAACPLACRLWNDRREHTLAISIFRWLLAEAEAVGDTRLAEHERKNVGTRAS